MFKIMAEFVEGFERLERIGPCVTIFGSARTKEEMPITNKLWIFQKRLLLRVLESLPVRTRHHGSW